MVQQHKREQRKKQLKLKGNRARTKSDFDDETPDGDRHVPVVDTETGIVLKGEDAPTADELDAWLACHPGYGIIACLINDFTPAKSKIDKFSKITT